MPTDTASHRQQLPSSSFCNQTIGQAVIIEIVGNLATITGLRDDIFKAALCYEETVARHEGSQGIRFKRIKRRLYNDDSRDCISIPAGFVPRVIRLCKQHGLTVDVLDHVQNLPRCAYVNEEMMTELNEGEQDLLKALENSHRGQLVVRLFELIRTIALICRRYPSANILIPVATKKEARRLYGELSKLLAGRVSIVQGGDWNWPTNRVICNYRSAETALPHNTDIVLFPEVATLGSKRAVNAITNLDKQQRYAILPSGLRLSRSQNLRLEGACGPVIHKSMPPGGFLASVDVVFCTTTPPVSPKKATSELAQKRVDYWHQDARNQLIAEIALGFRNGDLERLWQHGLVLDSDELSSQRVTVLVESAEHGRQLQKQLTNWQLLTNLSGSARSWNMLPDGCIATLTFANSIQTFDTDVVINAIGSEWIPEMKNFPPKSRNSRREILLVDLTDDANARLEKATRRRMESYRQNDWLVCAPQRWLTTPE